MAAVTAGASPAVDAGLRGPVPARTGGPAAADRSPAAARPGRAMRSWPLLVLAAPAAAEVWSGWVGIAQKTGFGLVSPLPGIWPSLHLDTAITLPVGVEAYAAYALRAWLAHEPDDQRPDPPVRQVVRDLLLRARHGRAGRLPPAGPGRGGTGTVACHHDRVLPAGPGPGHGDHAGPHAPGRRRRGCPGQRCIKISTGMAPGPVRPDRHALDKDQTVDAGSGPPVRIRRPATPRTRRGNGDHVTGISGYAAADNSGAPGRPEASRSREAGITASVARRGRQGLQRVTECPGPLGQCRTRGRREKPLADS